MHHQALDLARHPEKAMPTTRKMRAKDRPLANDLCRMAGSRGSGGSALEEAIEWLRDQLSNGPVPAKSVKESAEQDGSAGRTLERAKEAIRAMATRDSRTTGSGFGRCQAIDRQVRP